MSEADDSRPQFRIGTVARLTGLTIHQIRVWEKRYGTVEPTRSHGGDRLYSDDDVARLSLLKSLNDLGHSIGSTANLSRARLERMLAMHEEHAGTLRALQRESRGADEGPFSPKSEDISQPFLTAISQLDVLKAERLLAKAASACEPMVLVSRILLPMLQRIGDLWESGQFTVAHEHAASAVLRTQLGALTRTFVTNEKAPIAVCTTPAAELHEFGALSAALYVASRGWRVVYLGPNLPAEEISQAVKISGARLVLLSVVHVTDDLTEELRRLCESLPNEAGVVVGGAGAADLAGLPTRVRRAHALADLDYFL